LDVRLGSISDITTALTDFRLTPVSKHRLSARIAVNFAKLPELLPYLLGRWIQARRKNRLKGGRNANEET
jgi:hypothetical protein